jgi:hypothetical protein
MHTNLSKLSLNQETLRNLNQPRAGNALCASTPISCDTKFLSCPECPTPPQTTNKAV